MDVEGIYTKVVTTSDMAAGAPHQRVQCTAVRARTSMGAPLFCRPAALVVGPACLGSPQQTLEWAIRGACEPEMHVAGLGNA